MGDAPQHQSSSLTGMCQRRPIVFLYAFSNALADLHADWIAARAPTFSVRQSRRLSAQVDERRLYKEKRWSDTFREICPSTDDATSATSHGWQ